MSFSLRAAALSVVGAIALATPALAGEGWIADYDEAVKLAKAEKKDLFVDFTGSDWCIWCKRLDSEVFSTPEFLDEAKKHFVLVALDFPNSEEAKAKVPNPKRNQELSELHGIQGFPTVLLMTADGDVFGQTGYIKGGPKPFLENLGELRTKGKEELATARASIAEFDKAEGDAKIAAWDKIAAAFEAAKPESVAIKLLAKPMRAALEFDKDNAKGKKKRAVKALLKAEQSDEATLAAGRELDPKNEAGVLELCVKARYATIDSDETARAALSEFDALVAMGPIKDKETGFFLNIMSASICFQNLNDLPRAKAYATKAKEIGSDNERALEFLQQVLDA
ncbi:MAG: thioredoxin family protein [Planctomycetes bacterium]|nr:thioredoxin family protein [Planctomycetota bacterium]